MLGPRDLKRFAHNFRKSLMMVLFFTFAGLPCQIKLKAILLISFTKCFGMESTDALYISLDKPKVLTIFILPSRVSFLRFQPLRVFSRFSFLLSFFSSTPLATRSY